MFNYFKAEGLNNLIWVWTTETGDDDWYPGDAYVDIVGRDIYTKDAGTCASDYSSIVVAYGNKMVALSECGTVGKISEQWAAVHAGLGLCLGMTRKTRKRHMLIRLGGKMLWNKIS